MACEKGSMGLTWFQYIVLKLASFGRVPRHIAFIMDGNRRYAKKHKLPLPRGHEDGFQKLNEICEAAIVLGVKYLTVYAFALANFRRSDEEVKNLMELTLKIFSNEDWISEFIERNGIRVRIIGNRDILSSELNELLDNAIKRTEKYDRLVLSLCLAYSGKQEIAKAVIKHQEALMLAKEDLIFSSPETLCTHSILRTHTTEEADITRDASSSSSQRDAVQSPNDFEDETTASNGNKKLPDLPIDRVCVASGGFHTDTSSSFLRDSPSLEGRTYTPSELSTVEDKAGIQRFSVNPHGSSDTECMCTPNEALVDRFDGSKALQNGLKTSFGDGVDAHTLCVGWDRGSNTQETPQIVKDGVKEASSRTLWVEELLWEEKDGVVGKCVFEAPLSREDITGEEILESSHTVDKGFLYSLLNSPFDSPPEVLIRTSGENRLSDFLIHQVSEHTMFYFLPMLWPEMTIYSVIYCLVHYMLFGPSSKLPYSFSYPK